ncbi:MAG: Cof-type HAD-IIB family hydrolase [Clostridia bacterium]|nr:Cof-type HAD-IIB family hydrolase [Clostridia bacterium]
MKKFEGILITTDLDDTLLRNDKTISDKNKEAIEYFKNNGGLFTFVTGRPPVIVGDIYNEVLPNAPIGCFNGGGIYDMEKKEYVWTQSLDREALQMVEYIDKNLPGMSIQICGFEDSYFCKMNESLIRHRDVAGFKDIRCHYYDVKETIAKVLFAHDKEEEIFKLRDMLNSHPLAEKYDFIRSHPEYYEILPKGMSKGNVVIRLADILGIDMKRTVAIGDNDNDASMISCSGLGLAVANASKAAKNAADIITVSNEEDAIAKLIWDIDEGKIKI